MKLVSVLISICILFIASETTFAQTGSNYYLPLIVGSHVNLYSPGNNTTGYSARTDSYSIEGTDTIAGQKYYREVGREIASGFDDIFRVLWLRADPLGNVIVAKLGGKDSTNIDSATVVSMNWLPNQFLTKGYSVTYNYLKLMGQFVKDSVISVSETVSVPAGIFNNCIEIEEYDTDSTGANVRDEYYYYAYGIGLVKDVVTKAHDGPYSYELTAFGTTGVNNSALNQTPGNFLLYQNYPNPFNPSTVISYQVPNYGKVSLKVFDLLGREVALLVNEVKSAGNYEATFNAANLPSGIYFYRLQSGSYNATKKLVLLK